MQDHYRNAPRYDIEYAELTKDIEFLTELALQLGIKGKILEFCCGTGRVTFPLVESGFSVVGVDITPAMLEVAHNTLASLPPAVQSNVALHLGDMRNTIVGHDQFSLVLIPFNSFLHMHTKDDQLAALTNANTHLKPGGYFLADVFLPDVARLARNMGPRDWQLEKVVEIPDEGIKLFRNVSFTYSPHNQMIGITWLYQEFELTGDKSLLTFYLSEVDLRVIFPGEWELLLQRAGFTVVEKWGSFDKDPFGKNSERMLFLCQKLK